MNVRQVAAQTGIRDERIIGKAQEFVRLSSAKFPAGLGPGEMCKAAACLELACSTSSHIAPPNRDVFVRQGCVTKKVYMNAYMLLQKALGAGPAAPTIAELALQHGCESLARPAEILLALYRKRFTARLAGTSDAPAAAGGAALQGVQAAAPARPSSSTGGPVALQADFSRPAFAVAALQLTAAKADTGKSKSLDVRKVLQQLGIPNAHYQSVVDSIKEHCATELGLDRASPSLQQGPGDAAAAEGSHHAAGKIGASRKGAKRRSATKATSTDGEGSAAVGNNAGHVVLEGDAGAGRKPAAAARGKRRQARGKRGAVSASEEEQASGDEGEEGDVLGGLRADPDEAWEVVGRAGASEEGAVPRHTRRGAKRARAH